MVGAGSGVMEQLPDTTPDPSDREPTRPCQLAEPPSPPPEPDSGDDPEADALTDLQLEVEGPAAGLDRKALSLGEANGSLSFPPLDAPWWRKLLSFSGVGFLVAVGYMDPGNWATSIAGGSQFGYLLLFIVLLSSVMAMFLQHLALRLGVATEFDLAQACRQRWSRAVTLPLCLITLVAIVATDLAEVTGSAIALNLLFSIPIWGGVLITAADCLVLLLFEQRTFRIVEILIVTLTMVIAGAFIYEMFVSRPDWLLVGWGFVPSGPVFTDPAALYVGIGILGATVMPHNLFLHSAVIQTRAYPRTLEGKWVAIKYGTIDCILSLFVAFLVNAAILILAGAVFYYGTPPRRDVEDIGEAYRLLAPSIGSQAASILFGVALLASGQQSTITGTLTGQVVLEGFLHLRLSPIVQRLVTRAIAILPAVVVAAAMGQQGINKLLILSQVILSLALSFATIPLLYLTSSREFMGCFVNRWWLIIVAGLQVLFIAGLNFYLVVSMGIDGFQF